jgi:hypothetical protein
MLGRLFARLVAPRNAAARQLVRDREELARRQPGGSPAHPIHVVTSAVIEVRAEQMPCPQCQRQLRVHAHEAPEPGLRRVDVRCQLCSVPRSLWFRIAPDDGN